MNVHVASGFLWPRPGRYEWIVAREVNDDGEVEKREQDVLVPRDAQSDEDFETLTRYEPLEKETGLFLQLASLEPTPEAVMAFAARFGPLSLDRLWVPKGVIVPAGKSMPRLRPSGSRIDRPIEHLGAGAVFAHLQGHGAVRGDSLDRWQRIIRRLGDLVSAWKSLGDKKNGSLRSETFPIKKWRGKDRLELRGRDGQLICGVDLEGMPAKHRLMSTAQRLLLGAIREHLRGQFEFGLDVGSDHRPSWFSVQPRSLESAIWFQFALAVLGKKEFRECEACGTPFEVSLDAFRTNRTLCSSACKAKAHRMRRGEALAMANTGKTAKQIAKQIGSKLSTVEKWLEERIE